MFTAAGRPVDAGFIDEQRRVFDLDRAIAAFDGDELVGTIGSRPLRMTLPGGGDIAIAAIGQGGVLPSHTRQGIMKELVMLSLRAALEHEEPLAAWTTSEWPLYERYGAGVATFSATNRLKGLRVNSLRKPADVRQSVRLVSARRALRLLPRLHLRCSQRPGGVPRDVRYWRHLISRLEQGKSADVLESQADFSAAFYCLSKDGSDRENGCCIYRIHQKWDGGLPNSELEIVTFMYTDESAALSMWSFLLRIDLVGSILIPHAPIQNLLRWMLVDGRRIETLGVQDHIWLRVLAPIQVLERRRFPPMLEPLTLQIFDPIGFTDKTTLKLISDGMATEVHATTNNPDIEMDIGMLSALVLGGHSVLDLAASGRIRGTSRDALLRLAYAFTGCQLPYTDTSF